MANSKPDKKIDGGFESGSEKDVLREKAASILNMLKIFFQNESSGGEESALEREMSDVLSGKKKLNKKMFLELRGMLEDVRRKKEALVKDGKRQALPRAGSEENPIDLTEMVGEKKDDRPTERERRPGEKVYDLVDVVEEEQLKSLQGIGVGADLEGVPNEEIEKLKEKVDRKIQDISRDIEEASKIMADGYGTKEINEIESDIIALNLSNIGNPGIFFIEESELYNELDRNDLSKEAEELRSAVEKLKEEFISSLQEIKIQKDKEGSNKSNPDKIYDLTDVIEEERGPVSEDLKQFQAAREEYFEKYKQHLAESSPKKRLGKIKAAVFGREAEVSQDSEVYLAKERYDKEKLIYAQKLYDAKKQELENIEDENLKVEKLAEFKAGAILRELVVEEIAKLQELKIDSFPPKEHNNFIKALQWYGEFSAKHKYSARAINLTVSTATVTGVLAMTGAFATTGAAGVGLYAAMRAARGVIGVTAGVAAGEGADRLAKRTIKNKKEQGENLLKAKAGTMDIGEGYFEHLEMEYQKISKDIASQERKKVFAKLLVSIVAGMGIAAGLSTLDSAYASGVKTATPDKTGKAGGTGSRPEPTVAARPTAPAASPDQPAGGRQAPASAAEQPSGRKNAMSEKEFDDRLASKKPLMGKGNSDEALERMRQARVGAQETVPGKAPAGAAAEIAPKSPEILPKASHFTNIINEGDGPIRVIRRQLLEKSQELGYKGDMNDKAALRAWADTKAFNIAKNTGFIDTANDNQVGFSAKSIGQTVELQVQNGEVVGVKVGSNIYGSGTSIEDHLSAGKGQGFEYENKIGGRVQDAVAEPETPAPSGKEIPTPETPAQDGQEVPAPNREQELETFLGKLNDATRGSLSTEEMRNVHDILDHRQKIGSKWEIDYNDQEVKFVLDHPKTSVNDFEKIFLLYDQAQKANENISLETLGKHYKGAYDFGDNYTSAKIDYLKFIQGNDTDSAKEFLHNYGLKDLRDVQGFNGGKMEFIIKPNGVSNLINAKINISGGEIKVTSDAGNWLTRLSGRGMNLWAGADDHVKFNDENLDKALKHIYKTYEVWNKK